MSSGKKQRDIVDLMTSGEIYFSKEAKDRVNEALRQMKWFVAQGGYNQDPDYYYPWQGDLEDGLSEMRKVNCKKSPTTEHEWVNVSFYSVHEVCKHCDIDRKNT
jgi:hypothetical protein